MLEHVAANELFARLAFFELQTAGPAALDCADSAMDTSPPTSPRSSCRAKFPAPYRGPIREAIGSGIWAAIQHEIAHGREAELAERAPEITRIALAPLA